MSTGNLDKNSSFQEIINIINSLPVNPKKGATGNAQPNQVLSGVTFSNIDNIDLVGTMPNVGAVTNTISTQNGQYTIPVGYHDGTGIVKATFSNLSAGNVKYKTNVGGVTGSLIGYLPSSAGCGFTDSAEIVLAQNTNSYNIGSDKILTGFGINFSGSDYYAIIGYAGAMQTCCIGKKATSYYQNVIISTSNTLNSVSFSSNYFREAGTPMYIAPDVTITDNCIINLSWANNGSWSRFNNGMYLFYSYILK